MKNLILVFLILFAVPVYAADPESPKAEAPQSLKICQRPDDQVGQAKFDHAPTVDELQGALISPDGVSPRWRLVTILPPGIGNKEYIAYFYRPGPFPYLAVWCQGEAPVKSEEKK